MLQLFVDKLVVFSKTASFAHLLLEHPCKELRGLYRLLQRCATYKLFQHAEVVIFDNSARKGWVEELDPEPDELPFVNTTSFEYAVEFQVVRPVDHYVAILNINAYTLVRENDLPWATRIRLLICGKLPDRKLQFLTKYSTLMPSDEWPRFFDSGKPASALSWLSDMMHIDAN